MDLVNSDLTEAETQIKFITKLSEGRKVINLIYKETYSEKILNTRTRFIENCQIYFILTLA